MIKKHITQDHVANADVVLSLYGPGNATIRISHQRRPADDTFFFSSRRRHTRFKCDWSSDVCSSDLEAPARRGHRAWLRRTDQPALRVGPAPIRLMPVADPGVPPRRPGPVGARRGADGPV